MTNIKLLEAALYCEYGSMSLVRLYRPRLHQSFGYLQTVVKNSEKEKQILYGYVFMM